MSTIPRTTAPRTTDGTADTHAPIAMRVRTHRLLTAIALFAMVVGIGSVVGGIAGAVYTWDQAATQDITTPGDARIPDAAVRGPLTMWAQADIITHHQLDSTEGLYYSQMEREVPVLDEAGAPVLDEEGQPVMGPNEARASWVTATSLVTALQMGVLAYALAAFAIVVGLSLTGTGYAVYRLRDAEVGIS